MNRYLLYMILREIIGHFLRQRSYEREIRRRRYRDPYEIDEYALEDKRSGCGCLGCLFWFLIFNIVILSLLSALSAIRGERRGDTHVSASAVLSDESAKSDSADGFLPDESAKSDSADGESLKTDGKSLKITYPTRVWRDTAGRKQTGRLVKITDEDATLKIGKTEKTFPRKKFSKRDRYFLNDLANLDESSVLQNTKRFEFRTWSPSGRSSFEARLVKSALNWVVLERRNKKLEIYSPYDFSVSDRLYLDEMEQEQTDVESLKITYPTRVWRDIADRKVTGRLVKITDEDATLKIGKTEKTFPRKKFSKRDRYFLNALANFDESSVLQNTKRFEFRTWSPSGRSPFDARLVKSALNWVVLERDETLEIYSPYDFSVSDRQYLDEMDREQKDLEE